MKLSGADLRTTLDRAYLLATDSSRSVPKVWADRARILDDCPSKTPIPALGAALLAKATDSRINTLSLKARGSAPGSYSIRGPVRHLMGQQAPWKIYLGDLGQEPLNNNNWNQHERIDQITNSRDQTFINLLIGWLNEANKLTEVQALWALASFLRDRIAKQQELSASDAISVDGLIFTLGQLASAVASAIAPVDGGALGHAAVSAALSSAGHETVRTRRPNDPSPYDVWVLDSKDRVLLACEVKQKVVDEGVALDLAQRAAARGCSRALVVALGKGQRPLDRGAVFARADADHGVMVRCVENVEEVLEAAILTGSASRTEFLLAYPQRFIDFMDMAKVAREHRAAWASLCEARGSAAGAGSQTTTGGVLRLDFGPIDGE